MARRHSSRDGTITKLPSGHYRAQICIERRRLSATRPTRAKAGDWIREMQLKQGQGLSYDDERVTLGHFLDGWMATKKRELKQSSYDGYALSCRLYLQPKLGSIRIIDLTPARVQNFLDELVTAGIGVRSVQLARIILLGCLEQAKRLGIIRQNPAELSMPPKTKEKELAVWTESQVSQFLLYIQEHHNKNLYYLALATGMRRGELLGLKWEDVDWNRQRLMISRQMYNPVGGGYIFSKPKTRRGSRTIRLGSGAIEQLRAQLSTVDLLRRAARDKWQENDLVFPGRNGIPQNADKVSNEFLQLVRSSGLPQIRLHDLRHTAATVMLNHGIPPVIVAGMLGHSLAVLMNIYAHFIPDMQEEAARLMDEVMLPIEVKFTHELPTEKK